MKQPRVLALVFIALILVLGCSEEIPKGHFTATMVEQDGNETRSSKLFVSGNKYRVELTMPRGPITLLVDKDSQTAHIISTVDREYTIVGLDNQLLINKDPFLAVDFLKLRGQVTTGEPEKLNGFTCRTETLSLNDQPLLTQWIADELGFPIRIENHLTASKYIELRDIERKLVDPALFVVPAGYKQLATRPESKVTIPEWARNLDQAQVMDTPFERNFAAGDVIRIPVRSETSIWVKAEPLRGRTADVRVIPFVGGRPLQEIESFPNIIDDSIVCARRSETFREATEIVIRVFEGVAKITAKGVATTQKLLKDGKVGILAVRPKLMLEEFRLINPTGDTAIVSWDFYEDDIPLIADEHRVSISGRATLAPYEVKRSTIAAPGNRLHIRSEKGDVWVCLGQWDPNQF